MAIERMTNIDERRKARAAARASRMQRLATLVTSSEDGDDDDKESKGEGKAKAPRGEAAKEAAKMLDELDSGKSKPSPERRAKRIQKKAPIQKEKSGQPDVPLRTLSSVKEKASDNSNMFDRQKRLINRLKKKPLIISQ